MVTGDFIEDAKMQSNLINIMHIEANEFYKTEYKDNKVKINAQSIDDLMNNIELYSYLLDSEMSECDTEDKDETNDTDSEDDVSISKFKILEGKNPILDEPNYWSDIHNYQRCFVPSCSSLMCRIPRCSSLMCGIPSCSSLMCGVPSCSSLVRVAGPPWIDNLHTGLQDPCKTQTKNKLPAETLELPLLCGAAALAAMRDRRRRLRALGP